MIKAAEISETAILRWAAGANIPLPQFDGCRDDRLLYLLGIDEENVFSLLQQHRLTNLFLSRCNPEPPGWCSRTLIARLLDESRRIEALTRQQLQATAEISNQVGRQNGSLLVIKGVTTYLLTGDHAYLRYSGDVDLFSDNLPETLNALRCRGFWGTQFLSTAELGERTADATVSRTGFGGEHEFAALQRNEVRIELHCSHPVMSYPADLDHANLTPAHNPGVWLQTFANVQWSEITYEELLANSVLRRTPWGQEFVVPNPAMAAFLLCTHLFRHGTMIPPTNGPPAIKLVELAEIEALFKHPEFDATVFDELVTAFEGQDSLAFVASLKRAVYEEGLAPGTSEALSRENGNPFPRALAWWKGWAAYSSFADLLLPARVETAVHALSPNVVLAGRVYTAFCREAGEPLTRCVLHSITSQHVAFTFRVAWEETGLSFLFHFPEPLTEDGYEYHVELRGNLYEDGRKQHKVEHGFTISTTGFEFWDTDDVETSLSPCQAGFLARLTLPWQALPRFVKRATSLPLLLLVGKQSRTLPYKVSFEPMTVVPLLIRKG